MTFSDVAVVGLPDPRKDHAVIMARFARDCLQTVGDLTKKLEVTLGPDTGDLQIRVGLHSGPGKGNDCLLGVVVGSIVTNLRVVNFLSQ